MIREFTRRWRRWAAHHRVRVTMLFALIYVAFSRASLPAFLAGAGLVALGQCIRLWAAGHLQRNVELARSGPYALVRHPLYLGSLLMGSGLAIGVESAIWWLLAFAALYLAFYWPAMHVEELKLLSLFGVEYQEYMVEVPRLLPRLTFVPQQRDSVDGEPISSSTFSWRRATANLELRSASAMAALVLLQTIKYWLG